MRNMSCNTSTPHDSQWFAIHTHLNQENRAEANLRAWKVETFYPKIKEHRCNQFSGAVTSLTKPFFPQYLFARFDTEVLHKVWFTRGVQSVVSFGPSPCPVDDDIIEFLRARVDDNNFVRVGEGLKPGDKVGVRGGIIDSLVGIFEREMNDAERVMILLETINFQGHIIVEKSSIRKMAR
jgi:transcriptional antiterminator RfaH